MAANFVAPRHQTEPPNGREECRPVDKGEVGLFDTIITNGNIVDGTGGAAYAGDIGVRDGVVAEIGALNGAVAKTRIDAKGLAVAPGFIDIHTHSDFTLLVDGTADSQVHQGVTLEVVGQCGTSCAPFGDEMTGDQLIGYIAAGVDVSWRSFAEYLDWLGKSDLGVNVAAMVGHGDIRRAVMGGATRLPSLDDIKRMSFLAEECFDSGAIGFTAGLEYFPGQHRAPARNRRVVRMLRAPRFALRNPRAQPRRLLRSRLLRSHRDRAARRRQAADLAYPAEIRRGCSGTMSARRRC